MKGQATQPKRGSIHDEHFKHNFSDPKVVRDLLKHKLPQDLLEKIDLETIKMEPNEFLPSRYRTRRNVDLLYSIRNKDKRKGYTLLHLEAQSQHKKNMALRILEYHVAITRAHFKKEEGKIPFILTLVLYNGEEAWTSAKSVSELFVDFDEYVE